MTARAVLRHVDHPRMPERAGRSAVHAPTRIRHTVGTEVRAKYGLEAAQVLLGHSRADVTQTYAERDMKKAADVARQDWLILVHWTHGTSGVMTR